MGAAMAYCHLTQGDVVRGFRCMCRMGREELADRVGVSLHAVASWETNKRGMSLTMAKTIGKEFGIYEDQFWACLQMTEGM